MFTLEQVVPWGRSFDEYCRMFALSSDDLALRILGCGDGPASFNAHATRRGAAVTSCDPIYQWDANQIRERIATTYDQVLDQTRRNANEFVWDSIGSVDELGAIRMAAMEDFLGDYGRGKSAGRYVTAELPELPFTDASFDLAVCSHLLFLYSLHLDEEFHRRSVRELCRVARELRVFPLLALGGERSPYVDRVGEEMAAAGYQVSIERVPYEFQRGGNEMMRIRGN
ncbi:MAG TPA: class I SAM-dependent methyltransferase [Gemmatimonadaceae bacterium]|nr:class I SAM-dependent methyltransferase [Gemmatimonadaceae bacterium]